MEGVGLKLTPVVFRQLLGSLAYSDLWMASLGLIASLNREYNLLPAAHLSPPPF